MESLPNEVLSHLMDYFDTEVFKIGRLVSSHWNKIAKHRLKRDFQISIHDVFRLNAFLKIFHNTPGPPNPLTTTYFNFSGTLLLKKSSRKLLEKFCGSFGHMVTGLELHGQLMDSLIYGVDAKPELEFLKCTNLFLCHCQNIEELTLAPRKNFVKSSLTNLPTFANLRSITINYADAGKLEPYRNCILSQISNHAPTLSNVTISLLNISVIAKIISYLASINPKISLRLLNMKIDCIEDSQAIQDLIHTNKPPLHPFPEDPHSCEAAVGTPLKFSQNCPFFRFLEIVLDNTIEHSLKKLAKSWEGPPLRPVGVFLYDLITHPNPLRITEIDLCILKRVATTKTMKLLNKWLSTLSRCLKSLEIAGREGVTAMWVPPLPELEFLGANFAEFCQPAFGTFQLPQLKRLVAVGYVNCHVTPFIGSVFPLVQSADLSLYNREEVEYWPQIIPNVKQLELIVASDMLDGIFRFTNVVELEVTIDLDDDDDDEGVKHYNTWNQLTAGAPQVADEVVCSFPVDDICSTNSVDKSSFRDLTRLERLEFTDEMPKYSDCWKAIIYASRAGQLRRLKKLAFGVEHVKEELTPAYLETLKSYHDVVELNIGNGSEHEFAEEDFDNGNWKLQGESYFML